jgi:hypothetical protein
MGPYSVATMSLQADGGSYEVVHPADYSALGYASPIITWGNGTGNVPGDYVTLFDHLASWGFTVVASTLENTGSGVEILDGAHDLVAADEDAGNPFYGHLDTDEIAAMGHSQGATGAVRAAETGGSFISTVVTFQLPWNGQGPVGSIWDSPFSMGWSLPNANCPTSSTCWADPILLRQPTFFITSEGAEDSFIANPQVERCYFEEVHAPAVLGIVHSSEGKKADHTSIEDDDLGGNPEAFLGYVTDWLVTQLLHNVYAATAFVGSQPALTSDSNWTGSVVKTSWQGQAGCSGANDRILDF